MFIPFIDGGGADSSEISFDPDSYHFFTDRDVTNQIRRADKLKLVRNFDIAKDNRRLSSERGAGGGTNEMNESTTGIFVDQIINDPLSAPLETLDAGVKKVLASTGIQTILIAGAVIIALVIYSKR